MDSIIFQLMAIMAATPCRTLLPHSTHHKPAVVRGIRCWVRVIPPAELTLEPPSGSLHRTASRLPSLEQYDEDCSLFGRELG